MRTVAVGHGDHAVAVDECSGHVFVTNELDNNVSMVDGRSGAVLRTIPVGPSPLAVTVDEPLRRAFVLNGAPWDNGSSSAQSTVSLLDTRSGAVLHTAVVGRRANAIAIDARTGYAFVSNSWDATMSVLDARTGTVVHTVAVGSQPDAIAVDEHLGRVFVANGYGRSVSMVDARSGRVLRTLGVDLNPRRITVDQHADHVVVSTAKGLWPFSPPVRLQVLDGRTGRLLHTVAVGADASALAMDERTGDAFVAVNSDGSPPSSDSHLLRAWLHRWLPWVRRLLPPMPATTTGTVTMLDPARL